MFTYILIFCSGWEVDIFKFGLIGVNNIFKLKKITYLQINNLEMLNDGSLLSTKNKIVPTKKVSN